MSIAQAMAAGLRLDPTSYEIGRSDGRRCARWRCPEGYDLLSYASGYLEAQSSAGRACCDGERAQPGLAA